MATYVLGTLGTVLGGPIGGIIGAMIGGLVDRQIMMALTPNTHTTNTGPRLTEMSVTSSSEGAVMPRIYGRARLGGQVIWTTTFKEVAETTTETQGGGKGGGGEQTTTTTVYKYFLSFAVAFCEGTRRAQLGRVWLDSNLADLSKYTFRFHPGGPNQQPDSLIEAKEGADTPGYRNVTYIVFEDLPLEDYGNRMPQVTAEIVCPLDTNDPDDLQNLAKAWQMIPASGESVYGTERYKVTTGSGNNAASKPDNVHNNFRQPNAVLASNQLFDMMPETEWVSVVVGWFGTDLRAGQCRIIPKIEDRGRVLSPNEWSVGTYTRETAELVSRDDQGRPIYGGTPSDAVVKEYLQWLKDKGKKIMFYPFILMDIPPGNDKPDPYSDNGSDTGQAVFPWRGRITCHPAPGYAGSPDKTATAGNQVDDFFEGSEGYRKMALHYANLCDEVGGVDAFIIASELVGLTTVRSSSGAGTYPAVEQLRALANDCRSILGSGVKISYAADWSEYHSHRPSDGTNDVIFNMDRLWSHADIDFVGIDNYLPISDWRDGSGHLDYDAVNGPVSIYDRDYLKSQIEGGEMFDYYYASTSDRNNQVRTPIVDSAYGKHWVFRQKDIRSWWSSNHVNRPGGTESGGNTSWSPTSKPIWFTEFGCPSVDKGTNQPNVFYDPKSSESFFPYHSNGDRDDWIQRLYLEVMLQYWRDEGGSMLNTDHMFIWTWDARPFPDYPMRGSVWADGAQWERGHWLSGRADSVVLERLIVALCKRCGLTGSQIDTSGLYGPGGLIRGLLVNSQGSERELIEMLAQGHQFGAWESGGKLKFRMHINSKNVEVEPDDLVLRENQAYPVTVTRAQEVDLPQRAKITYYDELNNYQQASVDGFKGTGQSQNIVTMSFPEVLTAKYCRSLATQLIHQAWVQRETGEFVLPPSYAKVEPGDSVFVPVGNRNLNARIESVTVGADRGINFSGFDSSLFAGPAFPVDDRLPIVDDLFTSVNMAWMDIPLVTGDEPLHHSPRIAMWSSPWPGGVNLLREDGSGGFVQTQQFGVRAAMGELLTDLYSGPVDRWDRGNVVDIQFYTGGVASYSEEQLLAAGSVNAIAVYNEAANAWEVLQFASAELQSEGVYRISGLLRGLLNTETAMADPVPEGSRFVLLQAATVQPLNVSKERAQSLLTYRWGPSAYSVTDETYLEGDFQGQLVGLRPYSPVDARLHKVVSTGDLELTWKRRTRYGGDSWEQNEVPLNEEAEQYELVIYVGSGSTVARTVVLTSPEFTYTAAMQAADQGGAVTQVKVRIRQYGAQYGDYGQALEGTVYMRSAA